MGRKKETRKSKVHDVCLSLQFRLIKTNTFLECSKCSQVNITIYSIHNKMTFLDKFIEAFTLIYTVWYILSQKSVYFLLKASKL